MLMIICTWKSQRMGTSNLKLMPHSWTWGCTTFHNFLWMWKKKMKSWQVCDWLAKWLIMSGYMDLRRPRVYRRSNDGLVLNEIVSFPLKISLAFIPKCVIKYIQALVQIMAWRRPGDKPLSEPMVIILLVNICITRPQWVKRHLRSAVLH